MGISDSVFHVLSRLGLFYLVHYVVGIMATARWMGFRKYQMDLDEDIAAYLLSSLEYVEVTNFD